jgi:hypothetical protein
VRATELSLQDVQEMNSIFDSSIDIFDGYLSNGTFQDRENHGLFSDFFFDNPGLQAQQTADVS